MNIGTLMQFDVVGGWVDIAIVKKQPSVIDIVASWDQLVGNHVYLLDYQLTIISWYYSVVH